MLAQAREPDREPLVKRIRVIRINFTGRASKFILCIDEVYASAEPVEITTKYIKQKMSARNKEGEANLLSYAENEELSQLTQFLFMKLLGRMDEREATEKIEKFLGLCEECLRMPMIPA